jgi:ferredoxin
MKTARRTVQFGFLLLTVVAVFVVKGEAERWCPFGGVEAIYTYVSEGNMLCSLAVTNFYILAAVLLMTLLLRRAFCGYLCPIGTVSEWLRALGSRLGIRRLRAPYTLDRALTPVKYLVLIVILVATWRTAELQFRGFDPCYALISRHGEDITLWAYVIAAGIAAASLATVMPFCRWVCPLAAVLNPFSRFGLTRIRRHEEACPQCGVCARVCPMDIQVHKTTEVTAARCLSCLECVEACPAQQRGAINWGPPKLLGGPWRQGALIAVLLGCVGVAVAASYAFPLPSFVKTRGQPPATVITTRLDIHGVTCRGRATLLTYFLERDDEFELRGFLKIEAWPAPQAARVRITFDPAQVSETAIMQAITEPYFDWDASLWRSPPFQIAGYDPLGLQDPAVTP